jgi:hypothetical protein
MRILAFLIAMMVPALAQAASLVDRLAAGEHVTLRAGGHQLSQQLLVPEGEIDLGIDRRAVLRDLFHRVAPGSTDSARVESWVRYLQDRIIHPRYPPMHSAAVMVTDPIWILHNRIGQCGQTNRLLIDALTAVGFRARVVQLAAHVAAEAFYDGQWHFLDADWLGLGQFVRKPDGTIASTAEIRANPALLDSIKDTETKLYPHMLVYPELMETYASMFDRVRVGDNLTPYFLTKIATPAQERDLTFGWDYYRIETE